MGTDNRFLAKVGRMAATLGALLILTACRLVIEANESGHYTSDTGAYDCLEGSCVFPIEAPLTETFTARPAEGYRFVRWEGLCKRSPSDTCRVNLRPLPEQFSQFGGDIVRLWVSSVDWQNEVAFGEELFPQVADNYRRIRNTLRILLGNLDDFDHATDSVANEDLPLLDRWILERLHAVTNEAVEAYAKFEFRKVFNALNYFCSNDLSSLYVDITKDRMYCDAAGSTRRRATQTAMHRIFDSLCRLLAPILAYTADEAWEHAGNQPGDLHLLDFPTPDPAFGGTEATEKVKQLTDMRATIQQQVDVARKEKAIGSNLEASVTLSVPEGSSDPEALLGDRESVMEFFLVSDLEATAGSELAASVIPTAHRKCGRCWRHHPSVSEDGGPCDRCAKVLEAQP